MWFNVFSSDQEGFNNSSIDTTPRRILFGDADGNVASRLFSDMYIPSKTVVMWFSNDIPPGWAECNGENGTPDLRERFPIALDLAKDAKASNVGATGGTAQVMLETKHLPSHAHSGTTDSAEWGATSKEASWGEATFPASSGSHTHTFTIENAGGTNTSCNSDADCTRVNTAYRCSSETKTCMRPHNNIPPYYVLKFIMKL
jgi:microcystin-dependent protein